MSEEITMSALGALKVTSHFYHLPRLLQCRLKVMNGCFFRLRTNIPLDFIRKMRPDRKNLHRTCKLLAIHL